MDFRRGTIWAVLLWAFSATAVITADNNEDTRYFQGDKQLAHNEKSGWLLPADFNLNLKTFQKILRNVSMLNIYDPYTRNTFSQLEDYADRNLPNEYSAGLRELLKLFDPLSVTTEPELVEVLNSPKARLHYGEGEIRREFDYDYTVARPTRGCFTFANHGMYLKLKDFESVETFGTCIRLFNGEKCSQQSVAFYPSEKLHWSYFLFPWFPSGSIGPCTPQELLWTKKQNKEVGNTSIILYEKEEIKDGLAYSPNILNFLEFPARDDETRPDSPVWLQTTGHAGSILKLWAKFHKKHLRPNETIAVQPSDVSQKVLGSMEVKEGDILGYVIHPKLGGPAETTYNIIPQSKWNWREWSRICTELVYDYLTTSSKVDPFVKLTLNFDYDQWNSSRPNGFSYWIEQTGSEIYYGYLTNLK
ncbi:unnamed protein product [Allacma fusca]|uniref:Uncharacterized protein n=1 Tax=Allacma fusca TaxID=39272 RepID=A0A8J2K7T9_9HEXA|nr:unnamed protein product [Allacma fusca]